MSTNYYFHLTLGDSRTSDVVYKMHIGKSSGPGGLSTVAGRHFPDVESWAKFLRHNVDSGQILDEYGVEHEVEEFIADYLESDDNSSARQIQWLKDHGHEFGDDTMKIWDGPQVDSWRNRHWIDPESGRLFLGGEFF